MFTSSSTVDDSQIAVSSSSALSAIDEQFSDLPSHCKIPADDLMKMKRHSRSIGNFAAYLTIRLFFELFTSDKLRFGYITMVLGIGRRHLKVRGGLICRDICYISTHI